MVSFNLSTEDKNYFLQFIGCNTISDTESFYRAILDIANKSEWNDEDLQSLNMLINDGMGYFLQSIFRDKFKHPLYGKHFGKKVYRVPRSMSDLFDFADKLRKGEINSKDLSKHGFRISSTPEQFAGTK